MSPSLVLRSAISTVRFILRWGTGAHPAAGSRLTGLIRPSQVGPDREIMGPGAEVACQIVRWVADEPQPGLVEAQLTDSDGLDSGGVTIFHVPASAVSD